MAEEKPKNIKKDDVVRLTLDLSASLGWSHITLQDIAREADISLAKLHEMFEDKTDILVAFGRMIDRKVLENIAELDLTVPERDRIFDVLMERYEIINTFRPGLLSILQSFKLDPKEAVISLPHLCRSMQWMMEAAGLSAQGFKGAAELAGLTVIYLNGLRVWMKDDSVDLSKTMASLDKDLARAEKIRGLLPF